MPGFLLPYNTRHPASGTREPRAGFQIPISSLPPAPKNPMAHYTNLPPSSGIPFSPNSYTSSSHDSYSSSHPLFSPSSKDEYPFPSPGSGSQPYDRNTVYASPISYSPSHAFDNFPPPPTGPSQSHKPPPIHNAPRGALTRLLHHSNRLWLWEVTSLVIAIGAHFSMIALLGVYNNMRVSSWTKPWTLNSNISLMITIVKGAALIPVASCLGQLKWRRFKVGSQWRELRDLEYFDGASRGSLGSLRLLVRLRFWYVRVSFHLILVTWECVGNL